MRNLIFLFLACLFSNLIMAQSVAHDIASKKPDRSASPEEISLHHEAVEVEYFAHQLGKLKEAYAAKDAGKMVMHESAVLNALRNEINQLELKLAANAAQAERRKSAGSGQITMAAKPEEAPARDPFAEATTPDEIRFETMQYTLAAFERHAFDPSKPEEAARDFEKLEKVLKMMEEALAELKAIRK